MLTKKIIPAKLSNVKVNSCFWNKYLSLARNNILPYQYNLLNNRIPDAHTDALHNYKVLAGEVGGGYQGKFPFSDTQVTKWLEAVSYQLASCYDADLDAKADEIIAILRKAQCDDGYLNTYHTLNQLPRWSDLFEAHELFIAGHLIEAAVAHYDATGKTTLLEVATRFADYICDTFGSEEGKLHGCPGHEEVELALLRLYEATNNHRYFETAQYFVEVRGTDINTFSLEAARPDYKYMFPEFPRFANEGYTYCQAHQPVRLQQEAVGHAVRAVYLYCACAEIAQATQDQSLFDMCERIYNDISEKKMYITGSIGSTGYGEGFSSSYDLPNDTNYSETCASIGFMLFCHRMFQITGNAKYVDTMERIFYNNLPAAISLDGTSFFYVNPLEVNPQIINGDGNMKHIKIRRKKWFNVACCPPNIARTLSSFSKYIYEVSESSIYVNLFVSSNCTLNVDNAPITIQQNSSVPENGIVELEVKGDCTIHIRIPHWNHGVALEVNGQKRTSYHEQNGYIVIECKGTTVVKADFHMETELVYCSPKVKHNIGKAAVIRGPVVYCAEQIDNADDLHNRYIVNIAETKAETVCGVENVPTVYINAVHPYHPSEALYSGDEPAFKPCTLRMIPYHLWANRDEGEMYVWLHKLQTGLRKDG